MRVGVDGRELQQGVRTGIGHYVREVLHAVSSKGWECVVYAPSNADLQGLPSGITYKPVPSVWTQWWDQVRLPRQLAEDRITVFLSPYYKGPVLAGCPVVVTIHDLFFIGYPGRRRPAYDAVMTGLGRLYANRASAIIADSQYSKQSIMAQLGISADKVTVIPVALGKHFSPQPLTVEACATYGLTSRYILYVGNFKPHKNVPRLVEAYAALPPSLKAIYQLVLAGSDQEHRPQLQQLAERLGVGDRVVFPGLIADEDLSAIYTGCALFVLPSLYEGFGLPALEAMACGAAVAAANRAAIPEVVDQAALLFDPEQVGDITMVMVRGLTEVGLRDQLRAKGVARAREFSPRHTSGLVVDLLERVAEQAA